VSSCKACTSDGGSDPGCEEEPELEPSTECTAQYGNDFCYVLVTKDFQADGILRWNRGCCSPKEGNFLCPPDDDHHEVVEGVYERWRMRCDTDDCNIGDPRTDSGGGGNNEGGVIVHGRSSGSVVQLSMYLVTMLSLLKFFH